MTSRLTRANRALGPLRSRKNGPQRPPSGSEGTSLRSVLTFGAPGGAQRKSNAPPTPPRFSIRERVWEGLPPGDRHLAYARRRSLSPSPIGYSASTHSWGHDHYGREKRLSEEKGLIWEARGRFLRGFVPQSV